MTDDFARTTGGSGPAFARGALEQLICDSTTGVVADLPYLRLQKNVIEFDSLDEVETDPAHSVRSVLDTQSLLAKGGIVVDEWPNTTFVVVLREEWQVENELSVRDIHPAAAALYVDPFTQQQRLQFRDKVAAAGGAGGGGVAGDT
eukprot:gene13763-29155_t